MALGGDVCGEGTMRRRALDLDGKCGGAGDCQAGQTCLTHHLWEDLSDQIHSFLQSISLADLVTKNEVKEISENQDLRQIRMNDRGVDLRLSPSNL